MIFDVSMKDLLKAWVETIWEARPSIFKKDFWVGDFPEKYHPECSRCNLGSCQDCEYLDYVKK